MAARPLRVLLVEDDEGDALIVRLLLEDSSAPVVLTCVPTLSAAERRGTEALAAGAQDYLVKGHVDGELLARSVRYAAECRRADHAQRQLTLARVKAAENTRLERGLLPTPLVTDERLRVATHYRAGRRRALLGGDFYDVVEDGDGCVHAVIGDSAATARTRRPSACACGSRGGRSCSPAARPTRCCRCCRRCSRPSATIAASSRPSPTCASSPTAEP